MSRTADGIAREKARKEIYVARKWREEVMAKAKPARGAEVHTELLIEQIDQSPAIAVRSGLNDAAVEAYSEIEDMPDVKVFEGQGKYFLGDGRHRIASRERSGKKKINCHVTRCKTADDALVLARLHAFQAKATHGLMRSHEDKRAAVRACLAIPEYGSKSDRAVGELCKVGHWFVGKVRAEMTERKQLEGAAAKGTPERDKANPQGKKPTAKPKPAIAPQDDEPDNGTGCASTPEPEPSKPPSPSDPAGVAHPPAKKPAEGFLDSRGRIVPEPLAPLFQFGRAFIQDLRSTLFEVLEAVKGASEEAWGKGFPSQLSTLEGDVKKISQDVGSAVPWCCCPHVDETGTHPLGGKCKVCIDNRGWISRHNWHQLSDAAKKLIDGHAAEGAQPDAA